ncbi:hypothetical protein ACIQGZ_23925, partial [Streptomyces sp. NPDC092296]|uniref:hypothetical protein n=1 Tax=Streptomyces sp. NPDC092296 TaxID=3366012 RepID=UPI00381AA787
GSSGRFPSVSPAYQTRLPRFRPPLAGFLHFLRPFGAFRLYQIALTVFPRFPASGGFAGAGFSARSDEMKP